MFVNSDGDRWVTQQMRASPGSSDAVNTRYVLGRVDELVDYIEDENNTMVAYVDDGLYAMANRKLRTSEDRGVWEAYIAELDMWNDEVSGLADGFRVANIPLPNEPTI